MFIFSNPVFALANSDLSICPIVPIVPAGIYCVNHILHLII